MNAREMRKAIILAGFAVLALQPSVARAASEAQTCRTQPSYGGLFCNEIDQEMEVCELGDGKCSIDCGLGPIVIDCIVE